MQLRHAWPCSKDVLLLNFGSMNAGDIKKAKEGGVYTCEAFLMKTKKVWLFAYS